MMKRLLLVVICLLLVACTKKETNSIKIGAAGPLTGDLATFGADQLNGMKLAVEEWNAKGGVLGKKIVIVEGDDQRDPKQAVSAANKLVNEGVVGVVGHFNSNCSIPASEVYHKANIPQISHGSTNPKLTEQGFDNVFRVCGRDDQQGKVSADFAVNVLKVKRVAVIHDKTTYGQGLADEFRKALDKKAEVLLYEGIGIGEKDYSPVVTKIKALNPDLVFFGGLYVEGGLLIKQFKAVGGTAPFIGGRRHHERRPGQNRRTSHRRDLCHVRPRHEGSSQRQGVQRELPEEIRRTGGVFRSMPMTPPISSSRPLQRPERLTARS